MNENDPIRRGRHAVWQCHTHLVFVTKYRRGVFTDAILDDCETVMRRVCDDFGVTLVEFNGEDDHVHLLVEFPATVTLSSLVNSLKGVSSRRLRRMHHEHLSQYLWDGHLWSRSYYCGTVGGPTIDAVQDYISDQSRPGRLPPP